LSLAPLIVESTFNWYWLVDGLQAAGFKVHLANTTAILTPLIRNDPDPFNVRSFIPIIPAAATPTTVINNASGSPTVQVSASRPAAASRWIRRCGLHCHEIK